MDKAVALKKLNEYNDTIYKNKHICRFKSLAITLSYIVHIIMVIPFVANLHLIFPNFNTVFSFDQIPFLAKISAPYIAYTGLVKNYIIYGIVSIFIIPLLVAAITIIIGKFIKPTIKPLDESDHPIALAHDLNESFGSGYYYYKVMWFVYSIILILILTSLSLYGLIKYEAFFEQKQITEIGPKILNAGLVFLASGMVLSVTSILTFILKILLIPVYSDSSKYWKKYREEKQACKDFEKTLKSDKKMEDEARKAAQKAEAARIEKERLAKLAKEAEEKWNSVENPEDDEALVKKLADEGSPSACKYLGKKMYNEFISNSYTKSEKKWMCKRITEYLSASALAGDVDCDFIILSVTVQTISADLEEWQSLLMKARVIKKSGKLSEEYQDSCDIILDTIIDCVNRAEIAKKDAERPPVLKKKYCRFCDHGVCRYFPNQYSVATCDYVNDPGKCSIALSEKSIEYVYE